VASRGTIKDRLRLYLGVDSDDPQYSDELLNWVFLEAVSSLATDINRQNPSFNVTEATLTPQSSTSRDYVFGTQPTAITNFASWLEVRWTDSEGLELHECRLDEIRAAGPDHFTILREGIESLGRLKVSDDSPAGQNVWMRYTIWEAVFTSDSDSPASVPAEFHDVIVLEMLFAFAIGGEAAIPRDLHARWQDRRAQLIHYVGKRGVQNSRSRIYVDALD
jgi:hypothetical protein